MTADQRIFPSKAVGDRMSLTSFLDCQRATLAVKREGSTGDQLKRRVVPTSSLTALGLVRHAAEVETSWFRFVLNQEQLAPRWPAVDGVSGEFLVADAEVDEAFTLCASQRPRRPAAGSDRRGGRRVGRAPAPSARGSRKQLAERAAVSVGIMNDSVYVGKAGEDAALDRGWLLGHFKDAGDPRHSEALEIKWGVHPRGDERAQWVRGEERTALLVLISGRFHVQLPGRDVVLEQQGDYVVWGRDVDHSWFAEEESVVLTVRWPSVPGYAVTPD